MVFKIEFEGIDGSGKTLAVEYFTHVLRTLGAGQVFITKEVGNPDIPACIVMRHLMLDSNMALQPETTELLAAAMRFENEAWLKTFGCDEIVISDRGYASHIAYGRAMMVDHDDKFVDTLFQSLCKNTKMPHVIIHMDVQVQTASERRRKRGDRPDAIEQLGDSHQQLVHDEYTHIYNNLFGDRGNGNGSTNTYIKGAFEGVDTTSDQYMTLYEIDANPDWSIVKSRLDQVAASVYKQFHARLHQSASNTNAISS